MDFSTNISAVRLLVNQAIATKIETEDSAVIYTMMSYYKLARVNIKECLTHFLDHIHEYDTDYSLDIAEFLPSTLASYDR